MKKTFTINNFDKHLIIEDNGKTYYRVGQSEIEF